MTDLTGYDSNICSYCGEHTECTYDDMGCSICGECYDKTDMEAAQ